jgi:hypothetical protein
MKYLFSFIVFQLLFLSCTSYKQTHSLRWPASLQETKTLSVEVTLFSGPEMPLELVIAKSLPNAPLKIKLTSPVDSRVQCFSTVDKVVKTEFLLPANSKGSFESVSCKLTHSGSDYPEKLVVPVELSVLLDEFEIPKEEFKTKNELLAYLAVINTLGTWSPEMIKFVETFIPSQSRELNAQSGVPLTVFAAEDNKDNYYLNVLNFTGSFSRPTFLSHKIIGPQGEDDTNSKNIYPTFHSNSIVCGTGIENAQTAKILFGQGDVGQFTKMADAFSCQFNYRKKDLKDIKNTGYLHVQYKAMSYAKIKEKLTEFIQSEEQQIRSRIKSYHDTEYNKMVSDNNEIESIMGTWDKNLAAVVVKIDREKFLKLKNQTLTKLFPEKIQGTISRSASKVTLLPVRKIVYGEDGQVKNLLYLNITNTISYKLESPEIVYAYDRDLPFEERVNIYLPTSDDFSEKMKARSFVVCENKIDNFYTSLSQLEEHSNDEASSFDEVSSSLKKNAVDSIAGCGLVDKDKKEITYDRGAGKTDFMIQWNKVKGDDDQLVLQATKVGNTYSSDFLGSKLTLPLYRDRKYNHPAFKKGFYLTVDKKEWDPLWDDEKKVYIMTYDDEKFMTFD